MSNDILPRGHVKIVGLNLPSRDNLPKDLSSKELDILKEVPSTVHVIPKDQPLVPLDEELQTLEERRRASLQWKIRQKIDIEPDLEETEVEPPKDGDSDEGVETAPLHRTKSDLSVRELELLREVHSQHVHSESSEEEHQGRVTFSPLPAVVAVPKDQPTIPQVVQDAQDYLVSAPPRSHSIPRASDLSQKEIEMLLDHVTHHPPLPIHQDGDRGRNQVRFEAKPATVHVPKDQPIDHKLLQEVKSLVKNDEELGSLAAEWKRDRSRSRSVSRTDVALDSSTKIGSDLSFKEWELLNSKVPELVAMAEEDEEESDSPDLDVTMDSPPALTSPPPSNIVEVEEAKPAKHVHHVSFSEAPTFPVAQTGQTQPSSSRLKRVGSAGSTSSSTTTHSATKVSFLSTPAVVVTPKDQPHVPLDEESDDSEELIEQVACSMASDLSTREVELLSKKQSHDSLE